MEKILEKINKKRKPVNYKKTHLYLNIHKNEDLLDEVDVDARPESTIDLFYLEVLVNGLKNRAAILQAFDRFQYENGGDMYDLMEYGERQRLFNQDVKETLDQLPHFKTKAGDSIYIPCYNPEINSWYRMDIQRVFLKQHKQIIDAQDIFLDTPETIYGLGVFKTDFSSLISVYEDEKTMCFYSIELQSLYFFDRPSRRFKEMLLVKEENNNTKITGKDLQVMAVLVIDERYKDLLDFMLGRTYIDEKKYKRLEKII